MGMTILPSKKRYRNASTSFAHLHTAYTKRRLHAFPENHTMHGPLPVFFVYYLIGIHFCFSFLSICTWQISLSKTIYPIFGIAAIQKNYGYIGGSASGLTNGSIKKFGRNKVHSRLLYDHNCAAVERIFATA